MGRWGTVNARVGSRIVHFVEIENKFELLGHITLPGNIPGIFAIPGASAVDVEFVAPLVIRRRKIERKRKPIGVSDVFHHVFSGFDLKAYAIPMVH